jgi:hypothetical protein
MLLAACALAAGGISCGSVDRPAQAAPGERMLPAPPIQALDIPAPEHVLSAAMVLPLEGVDFDECYVTGPDGQQRKDDPASCRAAFEAHNARKLAPGSEPRLKAALQVSAGEVLWVEYTQGGGDECVLVYYGPMKAAPELLCDDDTERLDLGSDGFPGDDNHTIIVGTAPREADSLRLKLADGSLVRYPLEGPLLGFDRSRRVFMAESTQPFVRAEALHGDTVVATQVECQGTDIECPPS